MTGKIPRLRNNIDCIYTTQQGLDGRPKTSYFLADYVSGFRSPLSEIEAEILMALRRINNETSVNEVKNEVLVSSGIVVDDHAVMDLAFNLACLCMTGTVSDPDEIRTRQLEGRREAYIASQLKSLIAFLKRVSEEIPYYQEMFGEDLQPRIGSFDELSRFPLMSKTLLRNNFHRLQPGWFAEKKVAVRWTSSSGSTTTRTQTVHLPDEIAKGYATGFYGLGLNPNVDTFRVAYLAPPVCSGSECHMDMALPYEARLMPNGRLLILNSFRDPSTVGPAELEAILGELRAFQPNLLGVDAAYLAALARYLLQTGAEFPPIKAIITSYGVSSRIHINLIEKVFACPTHDLYSMAEAGPIAGACEKGNYHVFDPYHLEIVAGGKQAGPGELGKVAVTTLHNRLTPLLRYETGDLARVSSAPCDCALGHTDAFAEIEGRVYDLIADAEGKPVTPRAVDAVIARPPVLDAVAYYALVQRDARSYRLALVPTDSYTDSVENELRGRVVELLGEGIALSIEPRESLPPAHNGKFRLCYQEQQIDFERPWEPRGP